MFYSPICLFAAVLATRATLTSARLHDRGLFSASDTANDMQSVIQGQMPCQPVAVIFARGTFDSGNIGVWVGPQMFSALDQQAKGVAKQGVDASAYKADLGEYIKEGGSNAGATALASTVTSYAAKCPSSAIVVTGWSQGALVAHKGLAQLSSTTLKQVVGFVTFGDPQHLFGSTAIPAAIPSKSFCLTGTIFDPLCAQLPRDFKIPTSVADIVGPFASLPSIAKGAQEIAAAASLIIHFPGQLAQNFGTFVSDLRPGQFTKLLLTPQHFEYGNNGQAAQAAQFIANLPAVKAALAGGKAGAKVGHKMRRHASRRPIPRNRRVLDPRRTRRL